MKINTRLKKKKKTIPEKAPPINTGARKNVGKDLFFFFFTVSFRMTKYTSINYYY